MRSRRQLGMELVNFLRSWRFLSNNLASSYTGDDTYDHIETGGIRKPSLDPIPTFRPEWEDEFQRANFQPRTIRAVCCIGAVFFNYNFFNAVGSGSDEENGDQQWLFLTWVSNLVCGVVYFALAVLFSLFRLRTFCMKNYNAICSFSIVLTYITLVSTYLMTEIRRALFQNNQFRQIHWSIDYSVFLPVRRCNDSNPVATWGNVSLEQSITSVGCNDLLLSGGSYSSYVLLNLFPLIYRMGARSAIIVTIVDSAVLAVSALAVGTKSWVLFSAVSCQLAGGLLASYFCRQRNILARQQFSIAKGTKHAARQNSNLLYTLIPQNVVTKLATHKGSEMLGTSIKQCTIMFCSLEPQEEMQSSFSEEVFDLFHEAFSAFDRAVQRFGMFKYQHVGDWYIVACPRAACPFDEEEQMQPYPEQYSVAMVLLANELKQIAKGFKFHNDRSLWLKAGINCGPVAGAVIGSHRSFYCLYGDTINTSARMCKYAKEDNTHCTAEFAELLRNSKSSSISLQSRGVNLIKGKGMMETYDVSVHESVAEVLATHYSFPRSSSILCEMGADGLPSLPTSGRPWSCRNVGYQILASIHYIYTSCQSSTPDHVKYDELSAESRMWIANPEHGINTRWMIFHDSDFEGQFMLAHAKAHRQGLMSGLLLHVGAVICQWHLLTHPEYQYNFAAYGEFQLEADLFTAGQILNMHWAATTAVSIVMAVAMLCNPVNTRICSFFFVLLKFVHLACSILCFYYIPAEIGWTVIFSVEILLLHGWMGTLSYRGTIVLTVFAFLAFTTSLVMIRGVMMFPILKALAYALGSVWLSRIFNYNQRIRWRLHKVFKVELNRLRLKIFDLLPPTIAKEMIHYSSKHTLRSASLVERDWKLACECCTAVVLQLDICKFTVMSQTMAPIQVAEMVHSLFSVFDNAVLERNLFKMDTIGDAYVVAGFVSSDNEQVMNDEEVNTVCADILYVASTMIKTLEKYRIETGHDTHCRIGISTGSVIAGVLGRLQPRFHIFGEALRTAEKHEQTGKIDAVHASQSFVRALRTSGERRKSRSQPLSVFSEDSKGDQSSVLMRSDKTRRLSYKTGDLVHLNPVPSPNTISSRTSSTTTPIGAKSDVPLSPGQFDWQSLDADYEVKDAWLPVGWRIESLEPVTELGTAPPNAAHTVGVALENMAGVLASSPSRPASTEEAEKDLRSYLLYPAAEAVLDHDSAWRRQSTYSAQSEVGRAI